ncbi:gamma-glutamyl phosphate reductase [Actinomycetes bacterium]|nr:gamma-glutamyl phosphate reductase [Actinomycetes bacterium]
MKLQPHDRVLIGGELVEIGTEIANAFVDGDRLIATTSAGVLLIPKSDSELVTSCINESIDAFSALGHVTDSQIMSFYEGFARHLKDEAIFSQIREANERNVADAQANGRSTTRLVLSQSMRQDMIDALLIWKDLVPANTVRETLSHGGWSIESHVAPLGVVGFVFEGRPNVFADATGVLASRNVCVFRIGSDALETARAIMDLAVTPSLEEAGLPSASVSLLPSKTHAAAWALFSDKRLSLAVARGSGTSVSLLGEIAQQHGIPASLHGTGGAWMIVSGVEDVDRVVNVVGNSLDRKVCNTLNTVVFTTVSLSESLQAVIDGVLLAAQKRNTHAVLHVDGCVASALSNCTVPQEFVVDVIDHSYLGTEWEWENIPEISIVVVDNVNAAIELFNAHSPSFILSIISSDESEIDLAWSRSNAPFFGDGMTRWVDGQYALNKPELGLSNWQNGRTFARGGILSGDSIYTVRYRVRQTDAEVKR